MKRERYKQIKNYSKKMKYAWVQGECFYKVLVEDSNNIDKPSGKYSKKYDLKMHSSSTTSYFRYTGKANIMGHFWLHTGGTACHFYFKAKLFEQKNEKEIHFSWDNKFEATDILINAFQNVFNYYFDRIGGVSIYFEDIENKYCSKEIVETLVNYIAVELFNRNYFSG